MLEDLLLSKKSVAEAMVVTRAQANRDEVSKQLMQDLPFKCSSKKTENLRERNIMLKLLVLK